MPSQFPPADVSVTVTVIQDKAAAHNLPAFATERRIPPTWTISELKSRLETMTGIPPSSQKLNLKTLDRGDIWIEGDDELIGEWNLTKGCEIEIHDSRPAHARPNFHDTSAVEKYIMPETTYKTLPNTVLAWKKANKLGRFDPSSLSPEQIIREQVQKDVEEVKTRGLEVSNRAIVLPSTPPHIRRGIIKYIGPVPTIPSALTKIYTGEIPQDLSPIWVGIELDEPTGKNDGSINGKKYFDCPEKHGVFVKPEKVEAGDFPPLGLDLDLDDEMEEI
ncbi:hypothetical protein FQN57_005585 [Myotisia sp. PD_48]|nr:hypothetical protein FQN57_005585 [Myotisia sp. PD_48]